MDKWKELEERIELIDEIIEELDTYGVKAPLGMPISSLRHCLNWFRESVRLRAGDPDRLERELKWTAKHIYRFAEAHFAEIELKKTLREWGTPCVSKILWKPSENKYEIHYDVIADRWEPMSMEEVRCRKGESDKECYMRALEKASESNCPLLLQAEGLLINLKTNEVVNVRKRAERKLKTLKERLGVG